MSQTVNRDPNGPAALNPAGPAPPPGNGGHDTRGRFAPGNPGGPGNPSAGKVAAFRKALFSCLTEEDFFEISVALREQAKGGDMGAIRLLFAYVLGKPGEWPSPCESEPDEVLALRQRVATLEAELRQLRPSVPAGGGSLDGRRVAASPEDDLRRVLREDMEKTLAACRGGSPPASGAAGAPSPNGLDGVRLIPASGTAPAPAVTKRK